MGNCLVTKLKESVENSSLKKIDEVKLFVVPQLKGAGGNNRLAIESTGEHTIRVDGNGYFALSDAELVTNPKTSYTFTGSKDFYFGDNACNVFISNKSSITKLYSNGTNLTYKSFVNCDISELKFMPALKIIRFPFGPTYGRLSDIPKIGDNIENFSFGGAPNVKGDLKDLLPLAAGGANTKLKGITLADGNVLTGNYRDLGPFIGLTDLSVACPGVTGSVEELVAAQISYGRTTSNNLGGYGFGMYITFGG